MPNVNGVANLQAFEFLIQKFLNLVVPIAGILIFVMLLVGGFKYLTSGADPKAKESAGKTITYAILGLVVMLAGWFILLFIKQFTNVDVTNFTFPTAP